MFKLHIFFKESKGMHKIIQLISNFLYNKNMSPFMKVHVHYMNLMKNQIIQKFQNLQILKEKVTRKIRILMSQAQKPIRTKTKRRTQQGKQITRNASLSLI